MKMFILGGLIGLYALTSCAKLENESFSSSEKRYPLRFSIDMNKEVLPFAMTKAAPPLDMEEPIATRQGDEDLYDRIDYLVFQADEGNMLVKHKTYLKTDLDFGMVYDTLSAGNYNFCFLAHSSEEMTVEGQNAHFEDMSDTFHATMNLTIVPGEQTAEDVVLERVVSRIEFQATDPVPEEGKNFQMTITSPASTLGLLTGEGTTDQESLVYEHSFTDEERGVSGTTHGFFTFVPNPPFALSAKLVSNDQSDEVLRERQVEDITPVANQIIRYKGALYSPQSANHSFTIQIWNDGAWGEPHEIDLEDDLN